MKKMIYLFIIIFLIILSGCNTQNDKDTESNETNSATKIDNISKTTLRNEQIPIKIANLTKEKNNTSNYIKLIAPNNNNIYFGAFPDFDGPEDNVSTTKILNFQQIVNKKIAWAYFSNNWFNGITYPKKTIHTINANNIVPFVRLMPRSDEDRFHTEKTFSLDNIIKGDFDKDLHQWAKDAKEDGIPLLMDFAVEMNGDWFQWSGVLQGGKIKNKYGDHNYPDGPEKYRDAYIHIINIFRKENVTHVTWFFHPDIYSMPDEEWNQPKNYYPGDEYIDWIGFSIYGPQNNKDMYWETFSEILSSRYKSIKEISNSKPIAVLEFGVTDNHPLGNKSDWLDDAFEVIKNNEYINISAISYWDENWEEENGALATIKINSSTNSIETFQNNIANKVFVSELNFSNKNTKIEDKISNLSRNSSIILFKPETKDSIYTNESLLKDTSPKNWYKPTPGLSWQWQLQGDINTNYNADIYDVDLFDTPKDVIDKLHAKDTKVICYISAGSLEEWRVDKNDFPPSVIGNNYEGWPKEKWLDISNYDIFKNVILSRLDLAVQKECDGIEPDNINSYQEDTGFKLTYQNQIEYNIWLATEAHKRNLSIALKNDGEQINDLIQYYDFAIVEECFEWDECDPFKLFVEQNKAVLGVEYNLKLNDFCKKANNLNFSWLKMDYDLDGKRIPCK